MNGRTNRKTDTMMDRLLQSYKNLIRVMGFGQFVSSGKFVMEKVIAGTSVNWGQ
jgi:hypothetical protein